MHPRACETAARAWARSAEQAREVVCRGQGDARAGRWGWGSVSGARAPAREARAQPASTGEEEAQAPSVAPYVDRGLLYGPGQAGFSLRLRTSPDTWNGAAADVTFGLAAGITPRLTFDASLGTISIGPRVLYNRPDVGLWYGLIDTPPFELDATTHLAIDVGGANVFSRSSPARWRSSGPRTTCASTSARTSRCRSTG